MKNNAKNISVPFSDMSLYSQSLLDTAGTANYVIEFLIEKINEKGGLTGDDLLRSRELIAAWRTHRDRSDALIQRYTVQ
jgi:hypothetical protein